MSREKFEALCAVSTERTPDGIYMLPVTQRMWEGWKLRDAEIEALQAENERITALHSDSQYEHSIEVASLSALLEKAEAERDALRVDAERYKLARDLASSGNLPAAWTEGYTRKELDASIDAAMKGTT